MLENLLAARYLQLRKELIERRFAKMNAMQRQAVLTTEGPLLILAGAGSGKTTVLINRIANLLLFGKAYESCKVPFYVESSDLERLEKEAKSDVPDYKGIVSLITVEPPRPWEIMAITFTNKAAAELRTRLCAMLGDSDGKDINASTFHSACVKILRSEIERLGYKSGFVIYDSDDSQKVVKEILKSMNLDDKQFAPRSVLAKISEFKDMLEAPADSLARAEKQNDFRLKKVSQIYEQYQARLKGANALDFDDIITLTVRLFQQNKDVLEKYQRRYRYIMVDEYQDTNRSQYKLVSLLAGGYGNLCVVGDDDQSIYRFRGATIENILSFESQYEGAKVIRLEQNYRSTQNILTAANKLIAKNEGRKGKNLWTDAGDGDKITLFTAYDERDEAAAIVDAIEKLHREGRKYSECAVLYRMNAQSQAIELAMRTAGMPDPIIVGGQRFFDRKEIKDIIAYLSVIYNPDDLLHMRRIINEPKRAIGDATVETINEISSVAGISFFEVLCTAENFAPLQRKAKPLIAFAAMLRELIEKAEETPLDELLDEILDTTGYRQMLLAEGVPGMTRLENIEELKTTIKRYEAESEEPSLGGFLIEMSLYSDLDSLQAGSPDDGQQEERDENDRVTLMTMHGAKGLEFPFVFLPGMEEGVFPSSRSMNFPEDLEEERRLAYVAVTRAKERLMILSAKRRMIFGQTLYGKESRFLRDIPEELIERTGRKPQQGAAQGASCQQEFGAVKTRFAAESSIYKSSSAAGAVKSGIAPKSAAPVDIAVGDRVLHRVFGEGDVLDVKPMGGDSMLEIRFDKVGVKKIMATFARLQKL